MNDEIWRDIADFSYYQVSNFGDIKNKKTGKTLKKQYNFEGYAQLTLRGDDGKLHCVKVHVIVAKTFIPNPMKKAIVNHIDEDRSNCAVDNLEWLTEKENARHLNCQKKMSRGHEKPVNEYDSDGTYIRTWKSISDATQYYDVGDSAVRCAIKDGYRCANRYFDYYRGNTQNIDVSGKRKATNRPTRQIDKPINPDSLYKFKTDDEELYEIFERQKNRYVPRKQVLEDISFVYKYLQKMDYDLNTSVEKYK